MGLKGITVTLIDKVRSGTDEFGAPIYDYVEKPVKNVLPGQPTTDDITTATDVHGKKITYVLGIPKGDRNTWEDREVRFFGQRFKTFGKIVRGVPENMPPLLWDRKIWCEKYE